MDIDMDGDVFGSQRNPASLQPPQLSQPVPQQLPTPPQPPPSPQLPTPPEPLTPPEPPAPPEPPTPSRRDPARNIGGRRYSNPRRPSDAGESNNKWCSSGHHHRPPINFIENG